MTKNERKIACAKLDVLWHFQDVMSYMSYMSCGSWSFSLSPCTCHIWFCAAMPKRSAMIFRSSSTVMETDTGTVTAVARLWTSKSQVAGADGNIENFPERNVPNIPVRHVRSDTSRFLIHSMKLRSGWNMKKHNIPHGKGLSNLAFKSSVACYIHTGRDILIEICVSHRAWWILSHGNTLISQWI